MGVFCLDELASLFWLMEVEAPLTFFVAVEGEVKEPVVSLHVLYDKAGTVNPEAHRTAHWCLVD